MPKTAQSTLVLGDASGLAGRALAYHTKGIRINTGFVTLFFFSYFFLLFFLLSFLSTPQPCTLSQRLKKLISNFQLQDCLSLCVYTTSEAHKGNTCVLH